jgi:mono/diheme cytochrome c family protein
MVGSVGVGVRGLVGLFALVALTSAAAVASAEEPLSFGRDIRPILAGKCLKCHGPDTREGGLDLSDREAAIKTLKSGVAGIVPGKSADSEVIRRVTAKDDAERMPPPEKGPALTPEQVAKLRRWIDGGAKYEKHWAYVKPESPAPPAPRDPALAEWVRRGGNHPIDALVAARLERDAPGVRPAPEADRPTLLRRLSLDLTGLPPTPAEVEAFVADKSPDAEAYAKQVDRLLASPHYGEHMAAAWLDYARYADTNGYEKDERRTAWPYRDWVIDAFNRDLPFDRFTVEQIAGDLLPEAKTDRRLLIATGFHRNTMVNTEGGTDDEEFRVAAVVDRVNTTMQVWMGSTFACAQCHSHKYDPFSQADYYRLYAFFNATQDGGRSNEPTLELSSPEQALTKRMLEGQIAAVQAVLDVPSPELAAGQAAWEANPETLKPKGKDAKPLPPKVAAALAVPADKRDAAQREELAKHYRGIAPELAAARKELADLKKRLADHKATIPSTLVMREMSKPRDTHILIRGAHNNKGAKVTPGVPAALHPMPADAPPDRLGLARWLASPENPLVGRVIMNRVWARLFGKGIVETGEDFGLQGEPPSDQALLDHLAVEFVRRGWSLKAMLRHIVTSATYRQASNIADGRLQNADLKNGSPSNPQSAIRNPQLDDPFNRLLARGPRFRLDAETVRDNALAISGLLSRKIGGPSVMPHQPDGVWFNPYSGDRWVVSPGEDRWRRGLYTFWRRTAPFSAFTAFDAPSREVCCDRRPRTNTPLQALATLNDRTFVEASVALAGRMLTDGGSTDAERLAHGFRLCVARPPAPGELEPLAKLLAASRDKYRKSPGTAKMLVAAPEAVAKKHDAIDLAAFTVAANVLLNLDETITKP